MDDPHYRPWGKPRYWIAGLFAGVFGFVLIFGYLCMICCRSFRKTCARTLPTMDIENGDHERRNETSNVPATESISVDELSFSAINQISRFTYEEVRTATGNFTCLIGKGAFGPVYRATLPENRAIAVKVLAENSNQGEKEFLNEVLLLGRLHHKNLTNLVGFCSDSGHRILVFDFMRNGSLAARLHEHTYEPLTWTQRISIAQDIARGIEYLHDGAVPPVIHRDIKASNILLDSFMVARIADFGLSKESDSGRPASGVRGTYGYVDPEYFYSNNLTPKSDVYSFGIVLFELIAGRSPSEGLMEYVEVVLSMNGGRDVWLQLLDPRLHGNCDLKELNHIALIASRCAEAEVQKRPRISEVVQALARFRRTGGSKLDSLNLSSFNRFERKQRAERDMMQESSSMEDARG
ncbi:hypothetical protein KP509_31G038200 [Ceratopteris richardii]|uniref:non-specific serine/threonine protein kinase n=1 Tax=Ceratopteris richardii TaxID=49495 RepID=A0A8T2QZ15_CERRI|nr:hypothetical protein KP509_31G038200 [Ceratopteris richardii]KAH7288720.1 hypothetical protein KP509_31G038200 [Ceratopteris richardii]